MNTLIVCDPGVKLDFFKKEIDNIIREDDTVHIVKNTPLWKSMLKIERVDNCKLCVKESARSDVSRRLTTLAHHCDKVVIVSNGGKYTRLLYRHDGLLVVPDKGTVFGIYDENNLTPSEAEIEIREWDTADVNKNYDLLSEWRLSNMEHIDIDVYGSLPITSNDEYDKITHYVYNTPMDKLIRTINGSYITSSGVKRLGGINTLYSAIRIKGIYTVIGDGKYKPTVMDVCRGTGIQPLKSYILGTALQEDDINRVNTIMEPDIRLLNILVNDGDRMRNAVGLIKKHVDNGKIALVTDSDADGLTSATLGYLYFKNYLGIEVDVIINERRYGNGVNDVLVDKVLALDGITLVITADHGSADDDRYKRLRDNRIEILVTDHHTLPASGIPKNANEFINCMHHSSGLPSYISGCTVLYAVLYNHHLSLGKKGIMEDLIVYSGISVISDMMPLNRGLNRFLYNVSVGYISDNDIPWKKPLQIDTITYNDMSKKLISLINAGNRMGKAYLGFRLLTSPNEHVAYAYSKELTTINDRKKKMVRDEADNMDIVETDNLVVGISKTKYDGILGLLASKLHNVCDNKCYMAIGEIKDGYKGSMRCNASNINLAKLLQDMPELISKSGGHKNAAGLSFTKENLDRVIKEISSRLPKLEYCRKSSIAVSLRILTNPVTHEIVDSLSPYGVNFKQPEFIVNGVVAGCKFTGISNLYVESDGIKILIRSFRKLEYERGEKISIPVEIKKYGNGNVEYWT